MPQWRGRGKPLAVTNKSAEARHATMTHDPDRAPPRPSAARREANGAARSAAKPDGAAERRAAQLRENLRRRKRQQRLRSAEGDAGPD